MLHALRTTAAKSIAITATMIPTGAENLKRSDATLIDKNDDFVPGYPEFELMFGPTTLAAVRLPYLKIVMPDVRCGASCDNRRQY